MKIGMFSSWEVSCGIAHYASHLVAALRQLDDTHINVVPFDRHAHPRSDYVRWGQLLNEGDAAHIQHEYTFFGYLLPWTNHFEACVAPIHKPLVVTRHVSFDGPLLLPRHGLKNLVRQLKWRMYNKWLGPYAGYLNKGTFDRAQQIIVLSARLKEQLVARGVSPAKIHVIPAGVPEVPSPSGGAALRAAWGWQGKHILGVLGFITPAKSHIVALDALARLPERYTLLIAGGVRRESDRSSLADLRRRIYRLGLRDRVRITGFIAESGLPAHFDACDMLVYPATHVDSSYSMLMGLAYPHSPIIASDVFGHREMADRHAGVALFRSGDAADLARVIQAVDADENYRMTLLNDARQYARKFTWLSIAQQTREVYQQAIDQMRSP